MRVDEDACGRKSNVELAALFAMRKAPAQARSRAVTRKFISHSRTPQTEAVARRERRGSQLFKASVL